MNTTETQRPGFLIRTLGCKVNQYDSERIRTQLLKRGYLSLTDKDETDPQVIVVNTCSVTSESDRKGRQLIRKMIRRYPNARVVVTGCYSERKPLEIGAIEGVDEVLPITDQERWVDRISEELGWGCEDQDALWDSSDGLMPTSGKGIETFQEHTRAFVKIQDGCDQKCTFCSIPNSRGVARSRPMIDIIEESANLVRLGFPEIVLCGVCIGFYGSDLDETLPDLVRAMTEISGIKRVRISSLEPQDFDDDLIVVMAERHEIVCPHLHLPLQSGADPILRRMKRPYSAEYFRERVESARERIPDFEVSTDIITGFPGESEEHFQQSLEMIRHCRFNKVHSFRFSVRDEVPAARMKEHLSPQVIEERRKRLDGVADEVATGVKRSYIGRSLDVLTETCDDNHGTGFSTNYLRVEFTSTQPIPEGRIVAVKIESVDKGRLIGTVEEI